MLRSTRFGRCHHSIDTNDHQPNAEEPACQHNYVPEHAIATHFAHTHGGMRLPASPVRGGLTPFQAHATELLSANLSGRILLRDLANACDLSVRRFTRAFRQHGPGATSVARSAKNRQG
jgi:transcriptional regulator GlxA family with amidase domain